MKDPDNIFTQTSPLAIKTKWQCSPEYNLYNVSPKSQNHTAPENKVDSSPCLSFSLTICFSLCLPLSLFSFFPPKKNAWQQDFFQIPLSPVRTWESGSMKEKTWGSLSTGLLIMMEMPSDMKGLVKSSTFSRSEVMVSGAKAMSASCIR